MAKMTHEQFAACYKLGKQVYEKEISIEDAIGILVDDHHMNENSANMYINFFRHMMRGKRYIPSINQVCVSYYCENILRDYGVERLKIFLEGLKLHIEYNKNSEPSRPVPSLCAIHNKYSNKAGVPTIF